MDKKTVVTGTIGSDCHVVGTRLLTLALREEGLNVECLGAKVSQEEFIEAAIETNAAAILISSIYGQGMLDIEGFKDKCIEAGLKDIILYVGGSLTPGGLETASGGDWERIERKAKEMGFNRVYPPDTELSVAIADLKADLGLECAR